MPNDTPAPAAAPAAAAPAAAAPATRAAPMERYAEAIRKATIEQLVRMCGEEEGRRKAALFSVAYGQAVLAAPGIADCDPKSVTMACALSLLTDLLPGGPTPDVYLVPRTLYGTKTLMWQIGWRGLQKLAAREGDRGERGHMVDAVVVYAEDTWDWRGPIEMPRHVPADDAPELTLDEWDRLRGVYVFARPILRDGTLGGVERVMWVSRAKIEARRAVSDGWRSYQKKGGACPWADWPEEMAIKTGIRFAVARGIAPVNSTVARTAISHDDVEDRPRDAEMPAALRESPALPLARPRAADVVRAALAATRETAAAPPPESATPPPDDPPAGPTARKRIESAAAKRAEETGAEAFTILAVAARSVGVNEGASKGGVRRSQVAAVIEAVKAWVPPTVAPSTPLACSYCEEPHADPLRRDLAGETIGTCPAAEEDAAGEPTEEGGQP